MQTKTLCFQEGIKVLRQDMVRCNNNHEVIQYVKLPKSLRKIKEYSFRKCSALQSIEIPDGVTAIREGAFDNCSQLQLVILPPSLSIMDECLFNNCRLLQFIWLPDSLLQIKARSFQDCCFLQSIRIPNTVTAIEREAFKRCKALQSVVFSKQSCLEVISCYVFASCSSLENIELPDSLQKIQEHSFDSCTLLESIIIPNGVTRIGRKAFVLCTGLKSVTLSQSLRVIDEYAFTACKSLQYIELPGSLHETGEYSFKGCISLQSVIIPSGVTIIGSYSFQGCSSLQNVNIPSGVTTIRRNAFGNCTCLQTVILPNSLYSIGDFAFTACTSLLTISIPNPAASLCRDTFEGCRALRLRRTETGVVKLENIDYNWWLKHRFDNMPLHQLCYNINDDTENMLAASIQDNNGAFLATDAMGMTPLHILCSNPCATPNMIRKLLSKNRNADQVRNVFEMTPLLMLFICKYLVSYSDYQQQVRRGILQVHTHHTLNKMIRMGMGYHVISMVESFKDKRCIVAGELNEQEEGTGLYPFMISASSRHHGLSDLYNIAIRTPFLFEKNQHSNKTNSRGRKTLVDEMDTNDGMFSVRKRQKE